MTKGGRQLKSTHAPDFRASLFETMDGRFYGRTAMTQKANPICSIFISLRARLENPSGLRGLGLGSPERFRGSNVVPSRSAGRTPNGIFRHALMAASLWAAQVHATNYTANVNNMNWDTAASWVPAGI